MSLRINLFSTGEYKDKDDINIIFEVTNTSKEEILVLSWFTPLEGLRTSCLQVRVNKKLIPYDGFMVKRSNPSLSNFIRLSSGESAREKINLETAYDLPLKGNVTVQFDSDKLVAIKSEHIKKINAAFTNAFKYRIKKVEVRVCSFKLIRKKKLVKTLGVLLRTNKKSRHRTVGTPKNPVTSGMNQEEKKKMNAAHSKGYTLASDALTALANDAKYKKWFGAHTNARFNEVKNVYTKLIGGLETKEFTYSNNGSDCESGDIAYTTLGSDKIFICKPFWNLAAEGVDSQAGTVVHEHSHTSSGTDDHEYGTEACIKLAKDDPSKAIDNADNFEYYSET